MCIYLHIYLQEENLRTKPLIRKLSNTYLARWVNLKIYFFHVREKEEEETRNKARPNKLYLSFMQQA